MTTNAFVKPFELTIETSNNGLFFLSGYDVQVGRPLRLEEWTPQLFFKHEASFYGLNMRSEDDVLILTSLEIVELFFEKNMHPFVKFIGFEDCEQTIESFKLASSLWHDKNLWDKIDVSDEL